MTLLAANAQRADGARRHRRRHRNGRLDPGPRDPRAHAGDGRRRRRTACSARPGRRSRACTTSTSPTCASIRTRSSSPTTACCWPTSAPPPSRRRADQLATDRSQLLAASAAVAGHRPGARARPSARSGAEAIGALLPYLQTAAFATGLRVAMKDAGVDVDELRKRAAERSGVEQLDARAPAPHHGRHRRPAGAARARGGRDHRRVRQRRLRRAAERPRGRHRGDGRWRASCVVQTTRLLQAASTRATVPARLAFGPVYAMQLAVGFMNVALPSADRADGREHPVLPAPGRLAARRGHGGRDRLVRRQRRPGPAARPAARVLAVQRQPRPGLAVGRQRRAMPS